MIVLAQSSSSQLPSLPTTGKKEKCFCQSAESSAQTGNAACRLATWTYGHGRSWGRWRGTNETARPSRPWSTAQRRFRSIESETRPPRPASRGKTGNLDCSVISKNTGRGLALQTRAICHLSRRKHARKWRKTNHLSTAAAPTMMGLALAKPGAKMPRGPNRKSAHSLVFLQEGPNVSRLR